MPLKLAVSIQANWRKIIFEKRDAQISGILDSLKNCVGVEFPDDGSAIGFGEKADNSQS